MGGSGGGSAIAAVGGVVNIGVFNKQIKAFIGKNAAVNAQKDFVVSAESSQLLVGVAISIFGSGFASASGDVGTFNFNNITEAYIGTGAVVDSEGNVKLSAADDTLLISVVAVGNGAGALAMGAAVNVNTISSQTRAYIASGATVRARGNADGISVYTGQTGAAGDLPKGAWDEDRPIDLDGDGISDVDSIDKNPDFDKDGNPDGSVNGDIKFNVGGEEIDPADQGLGAKLTEIVKGLSVTAVSNQKFITVTIAIAGAGAAGVTGASYGKYTRCSN